ncbi:MAG: sugar-binding protein [Bacteroidales bacterium]|nr:sugar-binding protein [Bacteroidales bacterium]
MKTKFIKMQLALTFICFTVFYFGVVNNIAATDYWVSSSAGLNTNPGTQAYPFQTIGKAASVVTEGGTVHVAAGTYSENITTNANGSVSARIRYISDTKWGAKIIGSGTESMWTNNGNYTDIVDFDISGPGRIGILNLASHTLISGNHVHNLTLSGGCTGSGGAGIVNANYSSSDGDIIGNVVHDIGVPGGCNGVQGIYSSNLRGLIYNNIVYRVSAYGIHLWHAATDVIIANNTVFANGTAGMGGGIVIGNGDSPGGTVLNNTKVLNNIVYNNPRSSISEYCYSGQSCIGPNNVVANNLVYGNGSGITLLVGSATGTITADPQFVNYKADGTGDYHLKSTSPAIDAGTSTNAPSTDFDGNTRPQGLGYDIGAYEYILTSPTLTVNPSSLAFGNVLINSTSAEKTYTLTGNNLTANVTVTAPAGYEVSKTTGTGFASSVTVTQSSGNVNQTVYVRFKPTAVQAYNGNVTNASTGATTQNVALTGSGVMNLIAKKTLTQINIDGNINDCGWNNARSVTFTNVSHSNNSVTVHTLWDNNYFYISYEVSDLLLENPSGISINLQDAIELYLDAGHEKSSSIDATDYQYIINAEDSIYYNHAAIGTQIIHKALSVANGYNVEIAIPWGQINTSPVAGKTFGIDFCNDDRDNSTSNTFDWMNLIAGGNYKLPNLWGDVILSDTTVCTVTNVDLKTELNNINVYPNPVNTFFTLRISDATILKNTVMKIYDVCGKEVKNILITDSETMIDRGELQSGIYFYHIINDYESISKGKLLIQ